MYQLPQLPYATDALEPFISKEVMDLHHGVQHKMYVDELNKAEEGLQSPGLTAQERKDLEAAAKFNAAENTNHTLFWQILAPSKAVGKGDGGSISDGSLKNAIVQTFGSVDNFKAAINAKAATVQGSGWVWLAVNSSSKRLEIVTTVNQELLTAHAPVIGIDIWEHAYYLQYANRKDKYLENIFNVINFKEAQKRFDQAGQ